MDLSKTGRLKLAEREGLKLIAYRDTKKIWTIGIGHTSAAGAPKVVPHLTITIDEAWAIFERDTAPVLAYLNQNAARWKLQQWEFDALVSFIHNIGLPGFKTSTARKRLDIGAKTLVPAALLMWNKPPEIIGRRKQEVKQFRGL